jgi:hypothetical protein
MATGTKGKVTILIGGEQLPTLFLVGAVLLAAVLVFTFLVSTPARGIEDSDPEQRVMEADRARWVAMGEFYAAQAQAEQRAVDAYAARNSGLAAYYEAQAEAGQRAWDAYAARNTGLAAHFAAPYVAGQRAWDAYAARLTGQAENHLGSHLGTR